MGSIPIILSPNLGPMPGVSNQETDMAKAKSPKKPAQPGIPEALADHLQRQQNQAMLIACLLASVTKSVDSFDGTGDCTLVMRHIGCLIDDLLEALDSVSISKAAGVAS